MLARGNVEAILEIEKTIYEVESVDYSQLFLLFRLDWECRGYQIEEGVLL